MIEVIFAQVPTPTPFHAAIDDVVQAAVKHEWWEFPATLGGITFAALAALATVILAFQTKTLADKTAIVGGETARLAIETTALAKQSAKATDYEATREQRIARPILIAGVVIPERLNAPFVSLTNKGATAFRITVSGRDNQGHECPAAGNFIQLIGPGEGPIRTHITAYNGEAATNVRIRYFDAFDNKYMTEYKAISTTLAFPVFRLPSLGNIQPRRWSEQVTWAVEHFERLPGVPDEVLDPIPEDKG